MQELRRIHHLRSRFFAWVVHAMRERQENSRLCLAEASREIHGLYKQSDPSPVTLLGGFWAIVFVVVVLLILDRVAIGTPSKTQAIRRLADE